MRAALGLISLLIALVAVAVLAKMQSKVVSPAPASMQGEQLQQKFKQAVEAATQPRALPDDEK